jgi:hypothetical protein
MTKPSLNGLPKWIDSNLPTLKQAKENRSIPDFGFLLANHLV